MIKGSIDAGYVTDQFWRKVYVAVIRAGFGTSTAARVADDAVAARKERLA